MKIVKLIFLLCISYFYTTIAMESTELTPQEKNRKLEALSLELPKYPIYQYPTNYKDALENINSLMRIFDKTTEKNNIGFSFLKILKTEYEKLDKQKAILMARFDLTSQQKNLILEQEKARLTQLEQQLVQKTTQLEQLIQKAKEETK